MTSCSSCSAAVADDARFCPACGAPVDVSSAGTVHRADRPPSSGSIDHGRFVPGTMFGSRYRIVALLGRGGMGEVFRADDLKLGQPVALKLLPRELAAREDRRARLLDEVRIARQIAHPNVCRVYDIGEIDGEHFITMEYVTGEDLALLLQRIGRLPKDKGLEIARQICAGVAAAHERGVLHRDLKPANVMLDERGKVRITDFGLAALAGESVHATEGTPAYMAPEQLAGRETTARSDIYSLGLVLYELFTGKRAFTASSLAEMREQREQKSLTDPSRIVDDIDPAVERVILRCLENDPRDRPPSVVAVAAALPGGDPLAAALAAGETPSPELLAVAGDKVGLRPMIALPLLLFILIGSAATMMLLHRHHIVSAVDLDLSPDALTLKAREALRAIGYRTTPADSASGFSTDRALLDAIEAENRSTGRWERLREEQPPAIFFWYREADQPLEWKDFFNGMVTASDPSPLRAGMHHVAVDSAGRLVHLRAVASATSPPGAEPPPTDWQTLFAAADLDPAAFRAVEPRWLPPVYADTRAAWEGTSPTGRSLRIEAASLQGRPVYFQLVGPWTRPEQMPPASGGLPKPAQALQIAVFVLIALGAIFMAHRNISLGRGDRRGAARLAIFVLCLVFVGHMLHVTHVPTTYELGIVTMAVAWGLFLGGLVWLLYLALEPFVRRRWPHALIGWGKVLAGRFRDPLVGRDILIGSAAAVALAIAWELTLSIAGALGAPAARPQLPGNQLSDITHTFDTVLGSAGNGIGMALSATFLLFLFRVILRKEFLAIAGVLLLGVLLNTVGGSELAGSAIAAAIMGILAWSILVLVIARLGLLAGVLVVAVSEIITMAVPAPLGAWYGYAMWVPLLTVAAIAAFAFYTSLAGRPLLREALLET